jgi:phosphatidate cytidylyltransferase
MLRWRLLLGTLIVAALVGLCWLDQASAIPGLVLLPILVVFVLLGSQEILGLLRACGLQPVGWVVYAGNLLIAVAPWQAVWTAHGRTAHALADAAPSAGDCALPSMLALALAAIVLLVAEMWRYRTPGGATAKLAAGFLALVYVGLLLSFVVQIRLAWGVGAMAALLIVVKMGDTGAYTVGRLFGRHKMSPHISPGKTLEGAAGALACSCLASWAAFRWLVPSATSTAGPHGPWWGWLLFGLLVGLAGLLGDLAESLLKRDSQQKDSSTWMPGFGGILDMLDSILLAAPVAYALWALGLAGR